jgi:hypothetical protein
MKYYHGTSTKNFINILNDKKLVTSYNDDIGIYITPNFDHALNFGEVVIVLDLIKNENFESDNINDGIFYRNGIEIDEFNFIYALDGRVQRENNEHFNIMKIAYNTDFLIGKAKNYQIVSMEKFNPYKTP